MHKHVLKDTSHGKRVFSKNLTPIQFVPSKTLQITAFDEFEDGLSLAVNFVPRKCLNGLMIWIDFSNTAKSNVCVFGNHGTKHGLNHSGLNLIV